MFNVEPNTIIIPQPSLYIHCCALPLAATQTEELHFPIVRSNQSHVLDLTVITVLSLLPLSALIKAYCRLEQQLLLDSTAAERCNMVSSSIQLQLQYSLSDSESDNHVIDVNMSTIGWCFCCWKKNMHLKSQIGENSVGTRIEAVIVCPRRAKRLGRAWKVIGWTTTCLWQPRQPIRFIAANQHWVHRGPATPHGLQLLPQSVRREAGQRR